MVRYAEQQSEWRKEGEERVGSQRWIWSHNNKGTCGDTSWRPATGVTSQSGMFLEPLHFIYNRAPATEMVYWHEEELFLVSLLLSFILSQDQTWKRQATLGKGNHPRTSDHLCSLQSLCLLRFQTVLPSQSIISLYSQCVMDSSLFKVKNNPLYSFISSPHFFFYSTWLVLIDIFHLHGFHFLLTLWKMRKVTYTKGLGHKDQLRESDRLGCCII